MSTEYIIVMLPLRSDQVGLCKHQANSHQEEKDWADYAGKCGDRVWYEAPGKRKFSNHGKLFWLKHPLLYLVFSGLRFLDSGPSSFGKFSKVSTNQNIKKFRFLNKTSQC